jgi:hypothetical protein
LSEGLEDLNAKDAEKRRRGRKEIIRALCGLPLRSSRLNFWSNFLLLLMLCYCARGNPLAPKTESLPSSSETLVYASFFAPDSPNTLVRADTGQPWTALVGTWGTRRYQAYLSASSGDGNCATVLDAGIADANISVQLNDVNGASAKGIVFRATDANNFFFARGFETNIQVFRKKAGALVQLGAYAGGIAEGDVLAVELFGPRIIVKQNGITRLTLTDTFQQKATRHGLFADSSTPGFKHFVVEPGGTLTTDWVRVLGPKPYQIFQRDASGRANITVTGIFQGRPAAIEARWNGGRWQTLVEHPAGMLFDGSLLNQNAGQGILEVRFADNPSVFWRQRYIGIGDVYLIAGQSNAEGRIVEPQFYKHAALRASVFDQQNRWREAYDPTDTSFTNQYSVWPLLATKIMSASGIPVGFITTGQGATGLVAPGAAPWTRPGWAYAACLTSVRNSRTSGLKAILWYQGETDATSPVMTEAQYRDALKKLRRDLSADLGLGQLPLITAQLAYFHSNGTTETAASLNAVRLAQADPQDSLIFTGPILYDLNISEASGGDGQHIRTPAHAQVEAARWWQALKPLFYGGTEARGPRMRSLRKVDPSHIDVAWTLSAGPLRLSDTSGAGWRVTDESGPLRITAARLRDANTIRLTLERDMSGRTSVSWANYNDAVGVALTDSSADALPAEPFIERAVP